MSALCVECDAELNLTRRARPGQRLVCPNCGVQLEVISAYPVEVDLAYDDGEEWDDLEGYGIDEEELDELEEAAAPLPGKRRRPPEAFDDEFDEAFDEEQEFDEEEWLGLDREEQSREEQSREEQSRRSGR